MTYHRFQVLFSLVFAAFFLLHCDAKPKQTPQNIEPAPESHVAAPVSKLSEAAKPTTLPKTALPEIAWVISPDLDPDIIKETLDTFDQWAKSKNLTFSTWPITEPAELQAKLHQSTDWPQYIILDGVEYASVLQALRNTKHQTTWLVADALTSSADMVTIDFGLPKALFFNGIIAGGTSKSNIVGIITPDHSQGAQKMELAFRAGVTFIDPTGEVLYDPLSPDVSLQDALNTQIKDGADISLCTLAFQCLNIHNEIPILLWGFQKTANPTKHVALQRNWTNASKKIVSYLNQKTPQETVISVGSFEQSWLLSWPNEKDAWGSAKISEKIQAALTALQDGRLMIPDTLVEELEKPSVKK